MSKSIIHDGRKCLMSSVYAYRMADGVNDVDLRGKVLETNKVVIVRVKDCPVTEKDGRKTFSTEGVKQAVVLNYGATYYGYAMPKKNFKNGTLLRKRYVVENGRVYVCSWYETLAELWEQIGAQREQVQQG